MTQEKKLVIIAGMHRTGTSAITGAIEGLGIKLGDHLAAAQEGINDKGYMEDINVIDIHEDLLWSIPSSWDDIFPIEITEIEPAKMDNILNRIKKLLIDYFSGGSICALKDPRVCLFLPLWLVVCKNLEIRPCFIIPTRLPASVAQSLSTRDNVDTDRAHLLWIKYYLSAEKYSRNYDRLFITYESLLAEPTRVLLAITTRFDIALPTDSKDPLGKATEFVTPSLNRSQHNHVTSNSATPWISECGTRLYQTMKDMAACEAGQEQLGIFDAADQQYQDYITSLDPLIVDQIVSMRQHAVEFRRYWMDCAGSRLNKVLDPFRSLLGNK